MIENEDKNGVVVLPAATVGLQVIICKPYPLPHSFTIYQSLFPLTLSQHLCWSSCLLGG